MEQEAPIGLIGSWKILSVRYIMSDNGEIIDEPLEGVCSFDANGRWTVFAIPRATAAPTNDTERAAIYGRLEPIGNIPPAEAEARYYAQANERAMAA
jgi:hypothetical protein